MALGMTYDQYWDGDVRMVWAFVEADKIKQKRQNTEMWLMGAYVYDAISRLAPILNGSSQKPKAIPYPEKPYPTKEKTKVEKQQQIENDRIKAQLFFENWAESVKKSKQRGGEKNV